MTLKVKLYSRTPAPNGETTIWAIYDDQDKVTTPDGPEYWVRGIEIVNPPPSHFHVRVSTLTGAVDSTAPPPDRRYQTGTLAIIPAGRYHTGNLVLDVSYKSPERQPGPAADRAHCLSDVDNNKES